MKDKKILVTVVCYNNHDEVIEFVRHISLQSSIEDICVTVFVNSIDISYDVFKKSINDIPVSSIVINMRENKGYLNGMIEGVDYFNKNYGYIPEWVLMTNTDIELQQTDFFDEFLSRVAKLDNNISVVGPSVYDQSSGLYSNPHYISRISKVGMCRRIMIFSMSLLSYLYMKLSHLKAKFNREMKNKSSQNVYSVHGCCFFIRNDLARILINNPYGVLMYSEESYIAELLLQNNCRAYYLSNIQVTHIGSTVTSLLGHRKKSKYISDSLKYIYDRFYK